MKKAVFFDRDGTLIKEKNYLKDPKDIEIEKTVVSAVSLLAQNGYSLFIVTNQAGIARGYFKVQDFIAVQDAMATLFKKDGIIFDDYRFCPHHPTAGMTELTTTCFCRKPAPGQLLDLIRHYDIDAENSFMVGDKLSDIVAGQRAKLKSILVCTGYGKKQAELPENTADYVADTLLDAVQSYILK